MPLKTIPLTEADQQQLEKRGITAEIAGRLGWESCADRPGWVAIPFLRGGQRVNTKYRRIVKAQDGHNFEQDKGGEQCFYNLEALESLAVLDANELRQLCVVITEGEFDSAVALQYGFLAVSVPSGAPAAPVENEDSAKFRFLDDFPKFCIAILAVDDDRAGHALRHDLALRLGWHRCKWVQYPKGCKDLLDVAAKFGRKGIEMVLKDKAKFMNAGGLFRMSDLPAQPETRAYECGIGNVSKMIKLRPGDLSVFTGIPSGGKTTFVNALACNMARLYGWEICFGSFEHHPRGDHQRFLRTFHIGRKHKDSHGNPQWTEHEIAEADRWIDRHFSFIVPDTASDEMITLKWVLERLRAAITQYGADMVVIDPWNELDHDRPNGMTLTEYTGFAIKELKRLARQYMVHVTVVAHPAKPDRKLGGESWVPSLYDISDSAHFANKCDIGVVVHRVENSEKKYATLVKVQKIRDWGVIGRIGEQYLEYQPESCTYFDAPDFLPKNGKPNKITTDLADKHKPSKKRAKEEPLDFGE